MSEIRQVTTQDDLPYISHVFSSVDIASWHDVSDKLSEEISILQKLSIFPVELERRGDASVASFYLRSADPDSVWFIADLKHLGESFTGILPLLAFDIDQLGHMKWLWQLPGIEQRLLSKVAVCRPRPGLQTSLQTNLMRLFQARGRYIVR
jgi:hypothetical protein